MAETPSGKLVDDLFAAIRREHYATALEIATIALRSNPGDPWWEYRYAEGLRVIGRSEEARPLLVKVHPRKVGNRYLVEVSLGQVHEPRGEFAEPERWFRRATDTSPETTASWIHLGAFLVRRGRFEEACVVFEQGAKADGDRDEVFLNLGYCWRARGDLERAQSCFANALQMTPDYPEAALALSDVESAIAVRSAAPHAP